MRDPVKIQRRKAESVQQPSPFAEQQDGGARDVTPESNVSPDGAGHAFVNVPVSPQVETRERGERGERALEPRGVSSPGERLPDDVRTRMETPFGHDFSAVRIHADSAAAEIAESVDARALTRGDHIYFGPNEFAPATGEGSRLLAHELAHVVQQNKGGVASDAGAHESPLARMTQANVAPVDSSSERQAESAAALASEGRAVSAHALSPTQSSDVQRAPKGAHAAAPLAPAAPPKPKSYLPPAEAASGSIPADTKVVTTDTTVLQTALMHMVHWRFDALARPGVLPMLAALSNGGYWVSGRNMFDAMGLLGAFMELPKIDVGPGFLTIQVRIRPFVENLRFDAANQPGFADSSQGGNTLSQGTSTAIQNGFSATGGGGSGGGPGNGATASASATASTSTTSTTQGGIATAASSVITSTPGASSIRFKGDVKWGVQVIQRYEPGPISSVTSLGMANLGAHISEKLVPRESQIFNITSFGTLFQFPEQRCTPVFDASGG